MGKKANGYTCMYIHIDRCFYIILYVTALAKNQPSSHFRFATSEVHNFP